MHSQFETPPLRADSKRRRNWTELDVEAVLHNLEVAQRRCGVRTPSVMAVVKADGYGHGAGRVAAALAGKVHSFGVACVGEAEALRATGVLETIYLLSPTLPDERKRVVEGGFRPAISTADEAQAFDEIARTSGSRLPVQWVLDTGMGRMGTLPADLESMTRGWGQWTHLELESIASHFPSADEDLEFTTAQAAGFRQTVALLRKQGLAPRFVHVANSAGLQGWPLPQGEIVRVGLVLYGVAPVAEFQSELQPALTWKTQISLVREVPSDWGISYGRTHVTKRPTLVATLAVGYADGYLRHLSNNAVDVLIHGQRCPVLGRITMDQMMVDVSHLPSAPTPGTEVVLLGQQQKETITAVELARKAGTIPWEIFTSIRC